jgi:hypothetical protein
MPENYIALLDSILSDYIYPQVAAAWKVIRQAIESPATCLQSDLVASVALIDSISIHINLGAVELSTVEEAWSKLKASLEPYAEALNAQADVVRDFEARYGSIAFLKAAISAQNKLLVQAGLATEDELKTQMELEMLRYSEQVRS